MSAQGYVVTWDPATIVAFDASERTVTVKLGESCSMPKMGIAIGARAELRLDSPMVAEMRRLLKAPIDCPEAQALIEAAIAAQQARERGEPVDVASLISPGATPSAQQREQDTGGPSPDGEQAAPGDPTASPHPLSDEIGRLVHAFPDAARKDRIRWLAKQVRELEVLP